MSLPVVVRRALYRLAYAVLRVYWFVSRPTVTGVKFLLTDGEDVLLVRHTYGPRSWDVPGGSLKRGEAPLSAVRREVAEELGILDAGWSALGQVDGRMHGRVDRMLCFAAEVRDPALTVDRGEIAVAQWFRRDELPLDVGSYVPRILALPRGNR